MRKLKVVFTAFAVFMLTVFLVGCYRINGQKMDDLKGTYQLTHYTYTPSYERKEGYTPKTTDYITEKGYEVYLVVTGTNKGYYVHKDAETPVAYSKEVALAYEYSQEDSSMVEYVKYKDSIEESTHSEYNQFGVTKGGLNYQKPGFDYTQILTKKKMRSEDVRKEWKKVDKATDLSYVKKKLGAIKEYDYQAYNIEGVYEMTGYTAVDNTQSIVKSPYQYYFIAIDSSNLKTATIYYALKSNLEDVKTTATVTLLDGWNRIKIGDIEWTQGEFGNNYSRVVASDEYNDGVSVKIEIYRNNRDISETCLEELIAQRKGS